MTSKVRLLMLLVGVTVACAASLLIAQTSSQGLRLYVLDCGSMHNRFPDRYNLKNDEVPSLTMSVSCFLVVHPRGTLLYDAGLGDNGNNPNLPEGYIPGPKSLRDQLTDIGHPPDKITYFALSHWHLDHTGNANEYRTATWLVPRLEYNVMFSETQQPGNFNTYRMLKDAKTVLLDGDHDVFDDGSVLLKFTPGHTPGHQSLFVKLPKTGPVLIAGDLYHWGEERTLNRLPKNDFNLDQTIASRAMIEEFIKKTGAQIWIPHDSTEMGKRKKAPSYYD